MVDKSKLTRTELILAEHYGLFDMCYCKGYLSEKNFNEGKLIIDERVDYDWRFYINQDVANGDIYSGEKLKRFKYTWSSEVGRYRQLMSGVSITPVYKKHIRFLKEIGSETIHLNTESGCKCVISNKSLNIYGVSDYEINNNAAFAFAYLDFLSQLEKTNFELAIQLKNI